MLQSLLHKSDYEYFPFYFHSSHSRVFLLKEFSFEFKNLLEYSKLDVHEQAVLSSYNRGELKVTGQGHNEVNNESFNP